MAFRPGKTALSEASVVDLPLEVVMLLVGGVAIVAAGGALGAASFGVGPFSESGFHGLLLLLFALQTMALGKTPFGTVRRSTLLLAVGVGGVALGIVAGFVPGLLGALPRWALFGAFALGGGGQLMALALDSGRRAAWKALGGPLLLLAPVCAGVYALEVFVGATLKAPLALPAFGAFGALLALGGAVLFLAAVLGAVCRKYPEACRDTSASRSLPFGHTMLLVSGVFMVLLGGLLVPVSWGKIPFSSSAQLGLLLILFAVQTLAAGETPLGAFPRTRGVMAAGLAFAALGAVSCLIPGLLVAPLTVLVGGLNVAGGGLPLLRRMAIPPHPLGRQLAVTQRTLSLLSLLFGGTMFFPGVVPGAVVGVVLAANGGVLLFLLHLLRRLEGAAEGVPGPGGSEGRERTDGNG